MSTRRARPGGWVARKKQPCRWCGGEVPKRRWTFCGDACVHEWKLRTNPAYLREEVFERDRGVCAACGLDTEAMRKGKRKLDYTARRAFEKEWGGRRHLWDADHIVPVAEGGGECDLSNMRTLCLRCHRAATAALRARLLAARRSKKSGGPAAAVSAGMPGKKAHVKRNTETLTKSGGRARKSTGQTEGQYTRDPKGRKGQYTAAGDSSLTKK